MAATPTSTAQFTLGHSPIDILHFLDTSGLVAGWIDNSGTGQGNLAGSGGGSSNALPPASLTTTAAATDSVSIVGATASSHYSITPTNAAAATAQASGTVYISSKGNGFVVIAHPVTSGLTFDILGTTN
jgi:hypothetical protein